MTAKLPRILVVDDDPMAALLLTEVLEGTCNLTLASSGEEALRVAEREPPDLVLLDVLMPDLDGFETCRRIRACPRLAHVKVLLVSGMNRPEERLQGYEAGADDFVTKPFESAELLAKVRVYLRLKKAEELERLKTAFLANMSHEIRTPLNAVCGITELVLESQLTDEQREHLQAVSQSARSLLGILDEILDWSKIEAGRVVLETLPIDLRELLADTVRSLSVQSDAKSLELVLDVAPDVPAIVKTDPTRLRQIVTNLLGNAIKFTASGEVVVTVAATATAPGRSDVRIAVRDTGIGIDPAHQGQLFQSFHQADSSMTRRFGGTGLGLAISRRLAECMGGSLVLDSAIGRGSTFTVTLPGLEAGAPPAPLLTGQRLLVVDDQAAAAAATLTLLATLGASGQVERDPARLPIALAEAARAERPFAAVLIAAGRPGFDAFDLVDRLRELQPHLPVILSAPHALLHRRRPGDQQVPYGLRPLLAGDVLRALRRVLHLPNEASGRPVGTAPAHRSLRVLVVEDNLVNQRLACGLMARDGHAVARANDGHECLAALARGDFDLVLMDVQMPGCDGLEATRRIRQLEAARGGHLPIIGLTASAYADDRDQCLAAGMDAYLAKPFRLEDLRQLVQRLAP